VRVTTAERFCFVFKASVVVTTDHSDPEPVFATTPPRTVGVLGVRYSEWRRIDI